MYRSISNTEDPAAYEPVAEAGVEGAVVVSVAGHAAVLAVRDAHQAAVLRQRERVDHVEHVRRGAVR